MMRTNYQTGSEIIHCYICEELLTFCECRRCQECEELIAIDIADERCDCGGEFY
jgi:hypothetical protein